MLIRSTEITDACCVSACITNVACERQFLATTAGFSPVRTREYLELIWKKGGVHLVALEEGNGIVGWCDIAPAMFEEHAHVGRLGMGLLLKYRGQGWGKRLLAQVLEEAFLNKSAILTGLPAEAERFILPARRPSESGRHPSDWQGPCYA